MFKFRIEGEIPLLYEYGYFCPYMLFTWNLRLGTANAFDESSVYYPKLISIVRSYVIIIHHLQSFIFNVPFQLFAEVFLKWTLIAKKNLCYLLYWKPFQNDKKCFYFILKVLFVFKIFKFLSWLFGHVAKTAWSEI